MTEVMAAPGGCDYGRASMPSGYSSGRPPGGAELERWWERHSELDRMVEALAAALEGGSAGDAPRGLRELTEALDLHFRAEEDASFPLVERLAPDRASAIAEAREAHVELRAQLEGLAGELARGDLAAARRELARFLDCFHTHEQSESRLIAELGRRSDD